MRKRLFDDYAESYEKILNEQLSFFEKDSDYCAKYKTDLIAKSAVGKLQKNLEFLLGGGNLLFLKRTFSSSRIYGRDISSKSLEVAANLNPEVVLFKSGMDRVAYNNYFDLVFVACVFHHILAELSRENFMQLRDWFKAKGELFIFEHNSYNLLTQHLAVYVLMMREVLPRRKEVASFLEGVG